MTEDSSTPEDNSPGQHLLKQLEGGLIIDVVHEKVHEVGDSKSFQVTLKISKTDVETSALGLIFMIAQLSFGDALPAGYSKRQFKFQDEYTTDDLIQHLSFRHGRLCWDTDYVKGRRMKTTVEIDKDGFVYLQVLDRDELPRRWVQLLLKLKADPDDWEEEEEVVTATVVNLVWRLKEMSEKIPAGSKDQLAILLEPARNSEIADLDDLAQGNLPEEYRQFLLVCRNLEAPHCHKGYFLFSPLHTARQMLAPEVPKRLHVEIQGKPEQVEVLPIGSDGETNLFLLAVSEKGHGRVWKFSPEVTIKADGVASEGLVEVSESFTAFLGRLLEDWRHFLEGDKDWEYLSG